MEEQFCCDKKMHELGDVQILSSGSNIGTLSCYRYVCLKCGMITDIHSYVLDDEELLSLLENYYDDEEIKNSDMFKDLKGELDDNGTIKNI